MCSISFLSSAKGHYHRSVIRHIMMSRFSFVLLETGVKSLSPRKRIIIYH